MNETRRPRIVRLESLSPAERRALVRRAVVDLADYVARARPIVEAVRDEGDTALVRFARQFDRVEMTAERLKVAEADFDAAYGAVPADAVAAIREAAGNIRLVHERQKPPELELTAVRPGVLAGDRYVPIEAVACYVPRGKGAFPSVSLMTTIPAMVAGVPRVVIVTPPGPGGSCDAGTLVAAREAGVTEVYLAGGAQGVAAVAYGTQTVPKCRKIVGPGSPWVGAAMQLCADEIAPGPPAGPSESMVFADETAEPRRAALDLLVEAEHGPDSTTFLVCWDEGFAVTVADRVVEFLAQLGPERAEWAGIALGENGGLVVARDAADAVAFANEFAAEHLQIASTRAWDWVPQITNAGELLLGQDAPFSMANFMIGVNAVLPTGGMAATHSALGVMDYMKRQSIADVSATGYQRLAAQTEAFARYEGFDAHALAIAARRGN